MAHILPNIIKLACTVSSSCKHYKSTGLQTHTHTHTHTHTYRRLWAPDFDRLRELHDLEVQGLSRRSNCAYMSEGFIRLVDF